MVPREERFHERCVSRQLAHKSEHIRGEPRHRREETFTVNGLKCELHQFFKAITLRSTEFISFTRCPLSDFFRYRLRDIAHIDGLHFRLAAAHQGEGWRKLRHACKTVKKFVLRSKQNGWTHYICIWHSRTHSRFGFGFGSCISAITLSVSANGRNLNKILNACIPRGDG